MSSASDQTRGDRATAPRTRPVLTRREAAIAALGALIASGVGLVNPAPAFASGAMQYGTSNDAGASDTSLTSASTGYTLDLANTVDGGTALRATQQAGTAAAAYVMHNGAGAGLDVRAYGSSPALILQSTAGYGIDAYGGFAGMRIRRAGTSGPPSTGTHDFGETVVDAAGVAWRTVAAGTPGVWARVTSTIPLASPVRVIDTRNGTGGVSGPMNSMTWYTFNVLAAAGVPTQAIALIGNLTMVAATGSELLDGKGWMAILPATHATGTSASDPGVSSVNAGAGTYAIANQFTVGLGVGATYGGKVSLVFRSGQRLHAVVDITGYVI